MKTVERHKRDMEEISDPEKKKHVIAKFLWGKELDKKDQPSAGSFVIKQISKDGSKLLIQAKEGGILEKGEHFALFKLLARYLEIQCQMLEKRSETEYIVSLDELAIAKKDREHSRIRPPDGHVWITNVRTSQATIDANMFNIPTSVKVNFSDYERRLKPLYDHLEVSTFGPTEEKFDLVRKTGKILYLENTQVPESYSALNDDFIDYAREFTDQAEIRRTMVAYKNHKVVSEVVVPVIYINHEEKAIPIGFIHAQNKTQPISLEQVMEIKSLTFEMVDRIRDSNTVTVRERFPVLNLSNGGLRVLIDNPDLAEQLARRAGFTFDIFFKMQSPLTAFGLIKSVTKDIDGNVQFGISIAGNSSRPGERKRFQENVKLLQQQFGNSAVSSN